MRHLEASTAMHTEQFTLDNGLQVVLHPDRSQPLVAVDLWYHVGSRHDPSERTGLAHLFEHMLFQGSGHVGPNEHFARVQQVGGVANGSTWYDRTNYYETLPAGALELGLWLESDRMGFFLDSLDEERLETQRSVVINERLQRVDNQPYGRAGEVLNGLLYPEDHPYGWPVIGWMEDIEAATLEDVRDFFLRYYAPSNAVLALAGDFESETAMELVRRWFGGLPDTAAELDAAGDDSARNDFTRPVGPAEDFEGRRETVADGVAAPRVTVAWTVDGYGSDEWAAAALIASSLGGSRSARLYDQLVRTSRVATHTSAWVMPTERCATFACSALGHPETDPEELARQMMEVVDRFREDGSDDSERTRFVTGLRTDHQFGLQSLQPRADGLACCATYMGDAELYWKLDERIISQATVEAERQLLDRLAPRGEAAVTVVPSVSGEAR